MSGSRYVVPYAFAEDANGVPLAGALLYFYATGTSTPQATYSDQALSTPNTNPVVANASGIFPSIFLSSSPAYKVTLTDSNNVQQWTADPVGPSVTVGVPTYLIGIPIPDAGATPPAGAVALYGQAISRTTYPLTFARLGTTWGSGDGTTTFNLPDMRGRGWFGADSMGGTPANRLNVSSIATAAVVGAVGGHQLQQSHTHADSGHQHTIQTSALTVASGGISIPVIVSSGSNLLTNAGYAALNVVGGGSAQNMPPLSVGNWIMYLG